jgi:hypothetical protein
MAIQRDPVNSLEEAQARLESRGQKITSAAEGRRRIEGRDTAYYFFKVEGSPRGFVILADGRIFDEYEFEEKFPSPSAS